MDEEAAFLRAICAMPANDQPRLEYSDWLEEHGRVDQAEFIRMSIALDAIGLPFRECVPNEKECPCGGMGPRVAQMVAELGDGWLGPQLADPSLRFEWRRGFVKKVTCTINQFMGGGLCDRCVGRGTVHFTHVSGLPAKSELCPTCKGTGLILGLVNTLFKCHPVSEVRLIDCGPYELETAIGTAWYFSPAVLRRLAVPHSAGRWAELYDEEGIRGLSIHFDSESEAYDFMSKHCVALGRASLQFA
jgi:uncharacterized protein (TIGR02996 family)